jgi:hypothetical protein
MAKSSKPGITPGAGNVTITLGEGEDALTLTLRPTLQAGLDISRQHGGVRGAIEKITNMDFDAVVAVIRAGIGREEAKKLKNLEQLVYENGLTDAQGELLARVAEFLFNIARGGRPAPVEGEDNSSDEDPPQKSLAEPTS